jgi:hypothetical protein
MDFEKKLWFYIIIENHNPSFLKGGQSWLRAEKEEILSRPVPGGTVNKKKLLVTRVSANRDSRYISNLKQYYQCPLHTQYN